MAGARLHQSSQSITKDIVVTVSLPLVSLPTPTSDLFFMGHLNHPHTNWLNRECSSGPGKEKQKIVSYLHVAQRCIPVWKAPHATPGLNNSTRPIALGKEKLHGVARRVTQIYWSFFYIDTYWSFAWATYIGRVSIWIQWSSCPLSNTIFKDVLRPGHATTLRSPGTDKLLSQTALVEKEVQKHTAE